jgi:hypothetical protein
MAVYRLAPIEGTEHSHDWQASSIRPKCLWVQAEDEQSARYRVALATGSKTNLPAGYDKGLLPPWLNRSLTTCEYDETVGVGSGIIRIRNSTMPLVRPRSERGR